MMSYFRKLPFPFFYTILAAIGLAFVVSLQLMLSQAHHATMVATTFHVLTNYLAWAVVAPAVYAGIMKVRLGYGGTSVWVLSILVSIALIVFQAALSNGAYYLVAGWFEATTWSVVLERELSPIWTDILVSRAVDLVLIIAVLTGIDYYQRTQRQQLELSELKSQLVVAELSALKSQLNPHFLFNALHVTNSLIGKDDSKAREALELLSDLLRRTLQSAQKDWVQLKEEMDYLRQYLDLERLRFEDRLTLTIGIDEEAEAFQLPYLILQPLVENALKHGVNSVPGMGFLKIDAHLQGEFLIVSIENNAGTAPHAASGIGLQNFQGRLRQYYAEGYQYDVDHRDGVYRLSLKLPPRP